MPMTQTTMLHLLLIILQLSFHLSQCFLLHHAQAFAEERYSHRHRVPLAAATDEDVAHRESKNQRSSWQELLLTEEACEDIAKEVASRVELPFFCPVPIVYFVATTVVQALSTQLPASLVQEIGDAVQLDGGEGTTLDDLSTKMAIELNKKVDIPVLTEDQEQVVLENISESIVQVLTTSGSIEVDPVLLVDQSIETIHTLLGQSEGRRKLAGILNAKVDFPFLDEEAEEELLSNALDRSADRLQELLPPELVEVLRGEGPQGLENTKKYLADRLNEGTDLVGLNEEQEGWLISNMVAMVIDILLGDTEAKLLLMTPEEQKDELRERKVVMHRELSLCKRRYRQQKSSIEAQLKRINRKLDDLKPSSSSS